MIDYEAIYNEAGARVYERECARGNEAEAGAAARAAGVFAVVDAAQAKPAAGMITIPVPHVIYGPQGIPVDEADADYLRSAVKNIDHLSHGERLWGSNLTATVRKLLLDAAQALDPKGTQ